MLVEWVNFVDGPIIMSDCNICSGVVVGVCYKPSPLYNLWEREVRYVSIAIAIPLGIENWGLGI